MPRVVATEPNIHNADTWLRAIANDLRDYAEGEREATPGALYRLAATLDDICERALIIPRRHTKHEPSCGGTTGGSEDPSRSSFE
jgi:hypothetical protein